MNKKHTNCIIILFVAFVATVFLLNSFLPKREFSDVENRPLAQMPKFTIERLFSGKYTSEFETYLQDQFFARDSWVGLKYIAERALGKRENNGIYFGENGYLLSRFKTPDEGRLNTNFTAISNLRANLGDIPLHFSLVPSSTHILSDYLPENAPTFDQNLLLERAESELSGVYFDAAGLLKSSAKHYIFYRTDHHWTTDGAYIGYTAFCSEIGIVPAVRGTPQAEIPNFYGTNYSTSGARFVTPDTVTIYPIPEYEMRDGEGNALPIYDFSYAEKKDKYSVFLGGNHGLLVVKIAENIDISAEKLLLIKDSYSNALLPYLMNNFSEIHIWDARFNRESPAEYAKNNGIDRVFVLYSCENFASDSNIFMVGR